jgi:predicted TIM-barrel fold metal-dependent hydrolase
MNQQVKIMIIDFHAHVYPNSIAPKAVVNVGNFYQIEMRCDGTVQTLLERGRLAGIDRFVIHSVAMTPAQVGRINQFIASVCAEHTQSFVGFGSLHKDAVDIVKDLRDMTALGLKGVKLHPDVQLFNLDDPALFPVYEEMQGKMNLPLLLHVGDYRYSYSHPSRLARLLDLFPKLTVVGAHFGGWSVYDLALEYLKDKNCFLDISSSIMYLGNKRAEELIRLYGAERMLFASDYPMWDPFEELNRFETLNLTREEKDMILYQNASSIFSQTQRADGIPSA